MICEERLQVLDLFSLEKRDLRGDLQLKVVSATTGSGDLKKTEPGSSWRCNSNWMRGCGCKGEHGRLQLDTRFCFYYEVGPLLEEMQRHCGTHTPSLEVFKTQLDTDLSNLIRLALPRAGGVDGMSPRNAFWPT